MSVMFLHVHSRQIGLTQGFSRVFHAGALLPDDSGSWHPIFSGSNRI